jgi:hypothetical protein
MKNCYSHNPLFFLLFLINGCCSIANASAVYQLPFDTIPVDAVNADRYLFDMEVSAKIITLTGLKAGDHYELLINPFSVDNHCTYQIDFYQEKGQVVSSQGEIISNKMLPVC